jgi:hypothetical protein
MRTRGNEDANSGNQPDAPNSKMDSFLANRMDSLAKRIPNQTHKETKVILEELCCHTGSDEETKMRTPATNRMPPNSNGFILGKPSGFLAKRIPNQTHKKTKAILEELCCNEQQEEEQQEEQQEQQDDEGSE